MTPPDIQLLSDRVRVLGDAIAADGHAIRRLKAPFLADGLWVTSDGEVWSFHRRHPETTLRTAS